jgi:hypothetical protein
MGFLEIAANRAAAAQILAIGKGSEVSLTMAGVAAAQNGS